MNIKYFALTITCFIYGNALAKPFKIIEKSDPTITTHELSSGEYVLGITENGGGVINKIFIPGLGDIMGKETDKYGRAGQVAIRDASHGGRFNPTQAGFFETLGTQCEIIKTDDKLIVSPRPMALWHGDGEYDFTQWENIGPDPYNNDNGNSDIDGLDESNLVGKQETEVTSEFDYYGVYENVKGKYGITTAAFRHYFEIRLSREPGHAVEQFRPGTKLFNESALRADISVKQPQGKHPAKYYDLSGFTALWSLRHDLALWTHKYVYYRDTNKKWKTSDANIDLGAQTDSTVMILANSNDPTKGIALGLFRPSTDINYNYIIGRNDITNQIVHKDNRYQLPAEGSKINYSYKRAPTMSKYGFSTRGSGIINRIGLPQNVYESYRAEFYILFGTPQEIMEAVKAIELTGEIPAPDYTDTALDTLTPIENTPPTISITTPLNNAIFKLGDTITIYANASDAEGSIEKVNFRINNQYYSQSTNEPYSITFFPETSGVYVLDANAFDNHGLSSLSQLITISVQPQGESTVGMAINQNGPIPTISRIQNGYLLELKTNTFNVDVLNVYGTVINKYQSTSNQLFIRSNELVHGVNILRINGINAMIIANFR